MSRRRAAGPQAFEFVFGLGWVATHAVQVLQAGRRRVHGAEAWASLSLDYRRGEIHQSSRRVRSPVGEASGDDLRRRDESEWVAELLRILGPLELADYRQATTRARQPPKRRQRYRNGGHVSTHQILGQRQKPKDGTNGDRQSNAPTGVKNIARGWRRATPRTRLPSNA